MTTRAMIGIYTNAKKGLREFEELIYLDVDGYPEDPGVVRFLIPFMAAYRKNIPSNQYFVAANLVYLIKKVAWERAYAMWEQRKKEKLESGNDFMKSSVFQYALVNCGFSKGDSYCGGLRYIYRLNMKEGKILIYKVKASIKDEIAIEDLIELLYIIPFGAKVPKDGFTGRYLNENFLVKRDE